MPIKQMNQNINLTAKRIINTLENSNISAKDFAAKIGVKPSAISDWKTGKTTSYTKILPIIADTLQVDISYLLGRTNTPNIESDNFTPDNLRSDLVIPDILKQVGIGFSGGAENLTQEDIDNMALALEIGRRNKES